MDLTYETDRLILKVLKGDSAEAVLNFYLDNKNLFERYEPERPDNFYTVEHQKAVLICEYNLTVKLSAVRFYVFRKEQPDQIIGTICFRNITRSFYQSCEIGYKFDLRYQHQGYAFEALCMGISVMFADLGLHRIEANVMPCNKPSIRLLEAIGFGLEGTSRDLAKIRGRWEDHLRYSLIQASYDTNSQTHPAGSPD